jgi:4-amino-4-deoxychorismate lyase
MKSSFVETIKILDGKIYNLEYHQARYESVLNSLGMSKYHNLKDFIKPPEWGLYRCRLVYDVESVTVEYHAYKKRDISSFKLIFDNEIAYSQKSTKRDSIELLFSQKEDADEVLIIKNLLVTDTSIANVALFRDGKWLTPREPLLKGTTRERLLDEGKIIEADIIANELRTFSKIALLNAMVGFDIVDEFEFLI